MKNNLVIWVLSTSVLIVTVGAWSYIFFPHFFLSNNSSKTSEAISNPTPSNQVFYMVKEGSLYRWMEGVEPSLFVDKSTLQHEQLRIYGINDYSVSPDGKKIAVFAEGGVDEYLLFIVNVDGSEPSFIGLSNVVEWSANSQYIAYANRPASIGPRILFVYNVKDQNSVQTELQKGECFMSYPEFEWKAEKTIHAKFQCFDDMPYGDITNEGEVDIVIDELQSVD